MPNQVNIGDLLRIQAVFKNLNGVITDPTSVSLKIVTPDGVTTTKVYGTDIEVVKSDTGTYYWDYTIAQKGFHRYWAVGTGLVQAVEESTFRAFGGAPT